MKFCPLWSLFYRGKPTYERRTCIGEECGMYKLCNPDYGAIAEETKKESKKLRTFGGGSVEEDQD